MTEGAEKVVRKVDEYLEILDELSDHNGSVMMFRDEEPPLVIHNRVFAHIAAYIREFRSDFEKINAKIATHPISDGESDD